MNRAGKCGEGFGRNLIVCGSLHVSAGRHAIPRQRRIHQPRGVSPDVRRHPDAVPFYGLAINKPNEDRLKIVIGVLTMTMGTLTIYKTLI